MSKEAPKTVIQSAVKKFPVEPLCIPGAEIIKSPVYPDDRGTLYESFHVLKMHTSCCVSTITGVYPPRKTVYGPISRSGEEILYLIRGKLWILLIDGSNIENRTEQILEPGIVLRIPPDTIQAAVSLQDGTVYDIIRTESLVHQQVYDLNDSRLKIKYPESEAPLTQAASILSFSSLSKKMPGPKYAFAIFGARSMVGQSFVREFDYRGIPWYPMRAHLTQHEAIRNELIEINPPVSVIIASAVGTRPNTQWCELHHNETFDENVTSTLAVVGICHELGLHTTVIGTAGFFHYDKDHPLEGPGFDDNDPPNHVFNFYYKCREILEDLLKAKQFKNVLLLRTMFPIDHRFSQASLVSRLLKFETINSIPSSITSINDLAPLAVDMMIAKETGPVNWVCSGTITNPEILQLYQQYVDPSFKFKTRVLSIEESFKMGNPAALLIPRRLQQRFGEVPDAKTCVQRLMLRIHAEMQDPEE